MIISKGTCIDSIHYSCPKLHRHDRAIAGLDKSLRGHQLADPLFHTINANRFHQYILSTYAPYTIAGKNVNWSLWTTLVHAGIMYRVTVRLWLFISFTIPLHPSSGYEIVLSEILIWRACAVYVSYVHILEIGGYITHIIELSNIPPVNWII